MKLSQLLSVYPQLHWGEDPAREVSSICFDSRNIEEACVFVAICGHQLDGHDFLNEAMVKGAAALVVEDKSKVPTYFKGALVVVEDTREALDQLSARFYGSPSEKLYCVGVTGTNGKTSVTYMLEAIFNHFGWKSGVIGTINHHLEDHVWESQLTTPDPVTLQKRLQEFVVLGADAAIFEVSSHALLQKRADNIPFDAIVFTNLTRDHLDYHKDMEEYFQAKQILFKDIPWKSKKESVFAITNCDDLYGRKLQVADCARHWTFGQKEGDFTFEILNQSFFESQFRMNTPRGEIEITLPLPGIHNVYNAVASVAVGLAAGISLESCAEALKNFKGIPGRLEKVTQAKGKLVFVDYAHTDNAIASVLKALGEVRKSSSHKGRIITVFGCGGDRDKGKRPLMAAAAVKGSDFVVMTSDNPRTEDPMEIIEDGLKAVPPSLRDESVFVEVDRRKGIRKALELAGENDVVLIAGKGHEDYQIIGKEKKPFSDVLVVQEILSEL